MAKIEATNGPLIDIFERLTDGCASADPADAFRFRASEEILKRSTDALLAMAPPDRMDEAVQNLRTIIVSVELLSRANMKTASVVASRVAKARAKAGGRASAAARKAEDVARLEKHKEKIRAYCLANPGMTKNRVAQSVPLEGASGDFLDARSVTRIINRMLADCEDLGLKTPKSSRKV